VVGIAVGHCIDGRWDQESPVAELIRAIEIAGVTVFHRSAALARMPDRTAPAFSAPAP
jgi:hypothetical protein